MLAIRTDTGVRSRCSGFRCRPDAPILASYGLPRYRLWPACAERLQQCQVNRSPSVRVTPVPHRQRQQTLPRQAGNIVQCTDNPLLTRAVLCRTIVKQRHSTQEELCIPETSLGSSRRLHS
jgi:hypothetical protein